MIPTSIDGTDITGATIDGQDVEEITVDGQTVFLSAFSHFDDFDSNTLSDYEIYDGGTVDDSDFTISNSELQQDNTNAYYFIGYPVASENLTDFFAESKITSYPDNDWVGLGFLIGSTIVAGTVRDDDNQADYGEIPLFRISYRPATDGSNPKTEAISVSYSTPFTQRMEFQSGVYTLKHNGIEVITSSVNTSGSVDYIGLLWGANDPGLHADSFEIGEL